MLHRPSIQELRAKFIVPVCLPRVLTILYLVLASFKLKNSSHHKLICIANF